MQAHSASKDKGWLPGEHCEARKTFSSQLGNLSSLHEIQIYAETTECTASLSAQFISEYRGTHLETEQSLVLLPSPLN